MAEKAKVRKDPLEAALAAAAAAALAAATEGRGQEKVQPAVQAVHFPSVLTLYPILHQRHLLATIAPQLVSSSHLVRVAVPYKVLVEVVQAVQT